MAGFGVRGETDVPIRKNNSFQGGWFWKAGEDSTLRSLQEMKDIYYQSVGRNTNLLLGIVINDKGLVSKADVELLKEFGNSIKKQFSTAIAETSGKGDVFTFDFDKPVKVSDILLMEDIRYGERVRKYIVEGFVGNDWVELCIGESMGHKRLEKSGNVAVLKIRVRFTEFIAEPVIKRMAVF
jgi:alpha-L-fucosidase